MIWCPATVVCGQNIETQSLAFICYNLLLFQRFLRCYLQLFDLHRCLSLMCCHLGMNGSHAKTNVTEHGPDLHDSITDKRLEIHLFFVKCSLVPQYVTRASSLPKAME